jgi:hypothetical protein
VKKLTILVSAIAILLAVTGVAEASAPVEKEFTIVGKTTTFQPWPPKPLGKGPLSGLTTAEGDVYVGEEDVGDFSFEETVIFNPISGRGANRGTMTITTNRGDVVIRFGGQTNGLLVQGHFAVVRGTGQYARLHGRGIYEGIADTCHPLPPVCDGFYVDFTGRFHADPQ